MSTKRSSLTRLKVNQISVGSCSFFRILIYLFFNFPFSFSLFRKWRRAQPTTFLSSSEITAASSEQFTP